MIKNKKNIFLIGPMGAGKTTVGRLLAKQLKKIFYDSDAEIEKEMGVSLAWIFDLEGEQGLREREVAVIKRLVCLDNIVLSTGGDCVSAASVRDCLSQQGIVIYMKISLETQLQRLKNDKRRPLLQGGNPEIVLVNLWKERESYYQQLADFVTLTDHRAVRDVCEEILSWLGPYSRSDEVDKGKR